MDEIFVLSDQNQEKVQELTELIRLFEEERGRLGTFWDKNDLQ